MNENSPHYQGWRVTAASTIGLFFWSLPPYSFAVFLKPMAEELALSRETASFMYGAAPLVAALSAAPMGFLIDRVGARALLIPFIAVSGLAFALRGLLEPAFWPFVVLFGLSGLSGIASSPLAYARLISTWFDRRRGLALGLAISGGALGAMIHPPVANALVQAVGWRGAHVMLGSLTLLIGLPIVALFVRARPLAPSVRREIDPTMNGVSVGAGVRSPAFWVLAVVLLCDSIANSGFTVHLSALLTDRGIASSHSALVLSAMGAAALAGRLSTGWLLDRFFAARVSFALLVATATGTFLLSGASTFATAVLGAVLVGYGMGGESDVIPYLLSRYFGLRSFSTLYGFTYAAAAVASAIGPVLMGRTFDATGSYEPHLVRLVVALLGVAALTFTLPRYVTPSVAGALSRPVES